MPATQFFPFQIVPMIWAKLFLVDWAQNKWRVHSETQNVCFLIWLSPWWNFWKNFKIFIVLATPRLCGSLCVRVNKQHDYFLVLSCLCNSPQNWLTSVTFMVISYDALSDARTFSKTIIHWKPTEGPCPALEVLFLFLSASSFCTVKPNFTVNFTHNITHHVQLWQGVLVSDSERRCHSKKLKSSTWVQACVTTLTSDFHCNSITTELKQAGSRQPAHSVPETAETNTKSARILSRLSRAVQVPDNLGYKSHHHELWHHILQSHLN